MQLHARLLVSSALVLGLLLTAGSAGLPARAREGAVAPLPQHLADTGLFLPGSTTVRPGNLLFTPQYPLWSDGAAKRRWLSLPAGTFIDAARPDAWDFPRGTRLWKEFAYGARKVETRFIERLADGTWRFAVYVWNEEGTDAVLAPAAGIAAVPVTQAPGGRYVIPAEADCRSCHEGAVVPVLGASALQLSPDRDPLAPHAAERDSSSVDLNGLVANGWLRYLPVQLLAQPPRIAAASPTERAALGYLHANCGHCHNDGGSPAPVGLVLGQDATGGAASTERALHSMVGVPSRFRAKSAPEATQLLARGQADASVLALRMRSRNPFTQMPPVGTRLADADGIALIERWINHELQARKEPAP
jgi:hypothetical protein